MKAKYNIFYQNRIRLLEFIKVVRVCYPHEAAKQFREIKRFWLKLQQQNQTSLQQQGKTSLQQQGANPLVSPVGVDLTVFFDDKICHHENFNASFQVSRIRGCLMDPKKLMQIQGTWKYYSRQYFPSFRD